MKIIEAYLTKPTVSIIVPSFNAGKTLAVCLESMIIQSFQDFEIIVVDGQSTDNTRVILTDYNNKYPTMLKFVMEKDEGIYDAMNKGVKMARGKWILFLGADDLLNNPTSLSDIFCHPVPTHTKLIYGRAYVLPDNFVTPLSFDFQSLVNFNICHQVVFYSSEIFTKYKYDLKYPTLADWDLNLIIFAHYQKDIISKDVIVSTFNNSGVSSNWKYSREYERYFRRKWLVYFRYLSIGRGINMLLQNVGKIAGSTRICV